MLTLVSPDAAARISPFDRQHGHGFDQRMAELPDEQREATAVLYEFLFERFRKPAKHDLHTYIITSSLSYLAFTHPTTPVDAVFYPSVPYNGNGVNIAINESYNFAENVTLELVARNKFNRIVTGDEHSFEEVDLVQAIGFDKVERRILWP